MEFGVFCEHQLPRPWAEGDELRVVSEALDLVSGGRVEFGTGESASMLELGGFNIPSRTSAPCGSRRSSRRAT
ncbi:MAG: hypothetical protein WD673_14625 [Alphaproteobacteria bacterium]